MRKPSVHKKYLKLYGETAKGRILEVLFKFPEKEFSLSDLAREAGVAKANIGEILEKFHKIGLIEIVKLSKIWRIKANQKNIEFRRAKIIFNLNIVYQSGLVEFLNDYYNNPKAIILFGSFRKGEDISNSDIDIAVEEEIFPKGYKLNKKKLQTNFLGKIKEFEKIIGRKIQIHEFNRTSVDLNLFNNIANGIILTGFLEVKK